MTKTLVFLGPSLSLTEAKKILPAAHYQPPVQCGDIIRALQTPPDNIAIIDGYFEHRAAVWHKEILLALSQGINVYGDASMGALRAAELTTFGMRGVGKIYQDFYQGILNDDDEVTVVHRPDKSHYEPITDAMVNIRATLQQALQDKIITPTVAECLLQHAKKQFYKQRSLNNTIAWYSAQHSEQDVKALADWLAQGNFVDQKKRDAVELLKTLAVDLHRRPPVAPISINTTILLQKLNDRCQCEPEETSTEAEDVKRYTRLLAYLLKTSERLDIPLLTVKQAQQSIQNDKNIFAIFYCLFLLFDAPLLLQTDLKNAIHNTNKHLNILAIASTTIFAVREFLQQEAVKLNPTQIPLYMNEIMQLLVKKTSPDQAQQLLHSVDVATLINTYFILKDTINNGADAFLTTTPVLLNKPYYHLAQALYPAL